MKDKLLWWRLQRLSIALVWFYQGTWKKILAIDPHHLEIVSAVPSFLSPRIALGMIGTVETLFGLFVLIRFRPRLIAWLQIGTLVAMNTAGALFAGDQIPDLPAMLTMNFVFLLVIWGVGHYEP